MADNGNDICAGQVAALVRISELLEQIRVQQDLSRDMMAKLAMVAMARELNTDSLEEAEARLTLLTRSAVGWACKHEQSIFGNQEGERELDRVRRNLADRILKRRRSLRMTQKELGQKIGRSANAIKNIENGLIGHKLDCERLAKELELSDHDSDELIGLFERLWK